MALQVIDLISKNDEKDNKILNIPQIKLGRTVDEAFCDALYAPTSDCALMLIKNGAEIKMDKLADMLKNIKYNESHVMQNIFDCCEYIISYCNNTNRPVLFKFIEKFVKEKHVEYNDMIKILILKGIDVDIQNKRKSSPISLCSSEPVCEDLLKSLINKKAKINTQNIYGMSPLMYATYKKGYNNVVLLIQSGADLNLQDCYGVTALMKAIEVNDEKIFILLLNRGARTDITNNSFETVMDLAKNNPKMKKELLRRTPTYHTTKILKSMHRTNICYSIWIIILLIVVGACVVFFSR